MSNLVQTHAGVAIAFWMALAAVIVAAIVASVLKRRAGLAAIKFAIERGQALDEATVRALLGRHPAKDQSKDLLIHGVIWTALGLGFGVFGRIAFEPAHFIIVGLGVLMFILGIALLLTSRLLARRLDAHGNDA